MIISLVEWAALVGIRPDTAKKKAQAGIIPAFKIGRNWAIDDSVLNIDHRLKEHKAASLSKQDSEE